jgi:hypothetical protein
LPRPQISVIKRQREQAKRERQQVKAAKRAQRKDDKARGIVSGPDDDIDYTPQE